MGFIIGDALGVPYEFYSKDKIIYNNIDMICNGSHNMPIGSWSDDSSLMLCLLETINENGLDYSLLSKKMIDWLFNAYITPTGKTFGIGRTCLLSIGKLKKGISYLESGEINEKSNGNGSLMRILPLVFYLQDDNEKYIQIQTCSAITHAHKISQLACCIFVEYFHQLIKCNDKFLAYSNMQKKILSYFKNEELSAFDRILKSKIYELPESEISGLGYVVSTLECSLWCFINSSNYEECVKKAICIGNDTDTNAAIAGSLAGYYYNSTNKIWEEKLLKLDMIRDLINNFLNKLFYFFSS